MKKRMARLRTLGLIGLLAFAFSIAGVTHAARVQAENAAPERVQIVKEFFNEYAGSADGKNNFSSVDYVSRGVQMEAGVAGGWGNYMTACSYLTVPISKERPFSITITVPEYVRSDDPTESFHSLFTDILLKSPFDNSTAAQLRIYNDSATADFPDSLGTRMSLYDHFWAKDENDSSIHAGSGKPYSELIVSSTNENGRRIHFTEDADGNRTFTVKFDTENFFQTYYLSDGAHMKPYVDENSDAREQKVLQNMADVFEGTDCVKTIIRMGGMEYTEGGIKKQPAGRVRVTIEEFCGQSLGNTDGYLTDNVAPYAGAPKVAADRVIGNYTKSTYLVRSSANDPVTASTVFYSDFATDAIGYKNLSYKISLTDPSGNTTTTDGLTVSVGAPGQYSIALTVTDPSGNSYTTPATPFTVSAKFHIVLDGEMPTAGTLNEAVTLPTLYAVDSSGSQTDPSTGQAYAVTVRVTDPLDIDVAVADGKFTPTRVGNYRVRLTSKNADGSESDTQTFTVQVTEKSAADADRKGCGCGGAFGATSALMGVGLLLSAGYIVRKKK